MSNTKYATHSRVTIAVNDRSIKTPSARALDISKVFLNPEFYSDGEDLVPRYFADPISFKNGVGSFAYRTHGQSPYMAMNWIAGKGVVLATKLSAPDAIASHVALNIRTLATTVTLYQKNPDGSFALDVDGNKIETGTKDGVFIVPVLEEVPADKISALVARDHGQQLRDTLTALKSVGTTGSYTNNYAAVFKIKGRGKYGNRFGLRFALNGKNEKLIADGRRYAMTVVEKDKTGFAYDITDPVSFTFNYDGRDVKDTKSEFLSEVIKTNSFVNQFDQLVVEVDPDFHDTFAEIATTLGYSATEAENIDWIHGIDKNTKSGYEDILVPVSGEDGFEDVVDLSKNTFFVGGSDGALDPKGTHIVEGSDTPNTPATIKALKEKLLTDFYMGQLVPEITHPYLHRISYVLDAAYPLAVKEAMMHYAVNLRGDVGYKLDTLFTTDPYSSIAFKQTINNSAFSYHGEICYGYGTAIDPMNTKQFPATWTLEAAYQIPAIYSANGKTPRNHAGENNGLVTQMKMAGAPLTDTEMTDLTDAGIGYFETVDYTTIAKMSTRTLYNVEGADYSHLAEARNVEVVLEMLYTGRRILSKYRYDDSVSQEQNDIICKKEIDKNFAKFATSPIVSSMNTEIFRTADDVLNSEARCKVSINFEGFDKTFHLSIEPYRD